MKMIGLMVLVFVAIFGSSARAESTWHHVPPIHSDDVTALVDFQKQTTIPRGGITEGGPSSYSVSANPVWVNIRRADLSPQDRVHIMVINYAQTRYRGEMRGTSHEIFEQDLNYVEPGHFAGQLPSFQVAYQYNNGYALTTLYYTQELIVWINGRIYKDPGTGRNLRFNLAETR